MGNLIKRSYYQIKGIHYFVWVPVLVLYIIMPIGNYAVYCYKKNMDMVYGNILETCQYICPIFSIWYILFLLYHYIEQPGCEILYLNRICKLPDLIIPYAFYAVLMLPLFMVYTYMFPEFWWLYLKLCVVNILYVGMVYALSYTFKRIVAGIIVVLMYSVFVFMEGTKGGEGISYFSGELYTGFVLIRELIPVMTASVVLFGIGLLANYFFVKKWNT